MRSLAFSPRHATGAAIVLVVGAAMVVGASAAIAGSRSWRDCGRVTQARQNGYVSTNRVQARDGVRCAVARHIGLHFNSGGYRYRGLACFYAPMGSGDPYWSWSCRRPPPGQDRAVPPLVRGHLTVTTA